MTIITFSRTSFSNGEKIAESIASRLGYPCLRRRDLILAASEDFDFPETKLIETMEEPPRIWQQDRDKQGAHYNLIRATFLKRCNEQDNLIYHGFAGQALIKRIPHVLRILVIADKEYRIKEAMKQLSLPHDQIVELISKGDKKITKWTQCMFGFDWRDPFLYDLVLHMGRISVKSAEEAVLKIINSKDFKATQLSQMAFKDEFLGSLVWSVLTKNKLTSTAIC